MGILRADRVSGLGGANAIKGSVFYKGKSFIKVEPDSSFTLGTGDYTVEAWVYSERSYGGVFHLFDSDIMDGSNDSGPGFGAVVSDGQWNSYYGSGSIIDSGVTMKRSVWQHVALVRYSGTTKIYVNGTSIASQSDSTNYTSSMIYPVIGGWWNNDYNWQGYISNFRFVVGTAVYQSNFTPPTSELTAIDGTQILCFQTSDILREETGKTLFIDGESNNNAPIASRFTPNSPVGFSTTTDVGTQFGSTFDGVTTFDSQAYFVPPGGNTRERNRGRGVLGGGAPFVSPSVIGNMSFVQVQSQGNFQDFGDLTVSRGQFPAGQNASSTRGLSSGGWTNPTGVNTIDFITIANTANATDFGDTSITRPNGVLSNQTRSLTASNGDIINTIDFVTIATAGNASDFGDLLFAIGLTSGVSSPTRGVFGGGRTTSPSNVEYNTLQFITIASTGNAQDFGDLTRTRYGSSGFSSPTRGIFAGGYSNPQGKFEGIEFITIATLGNGTDFGDLSDSQGYGGSLTNSILGLITINSPTNYYNTIEFITITTTGNAKDFGDADPLGSGKGHGSFPSCMSDSHGGIE